MIILIILKILVVIFVLMIAYDMGYKKREKEFQDSPVVFSVGVENALRVDNKGPRAKVIIYNKNLVEFVK